MSDERYQASGSMANCLSTINQHMAEDDQHITSAEKQQYAAPAWTSIQGKPAFASAQWKTSVADLASLPLSNNSIGDMRLVLNAGNSKRAVFMCKATIGDLAAQWLLLAHESWGTPEWAAVQNKPALILADGSISFTGVVQLADASPTNARHAAHKRYVDDTSIINAIVYGGGGI